MQSILRLPPLPLPHPYPPLTSPHQLPQLPPLPLCSSPTPLTPTHHLLYPPQRLPRRTQRIGIPPQIVFLFSPNFKVLGGREGEGEREPGVGEGDIVLWAPGGFLKKELRFGLCELLLAERGGGGRGGVSIVFVVFVVGAVEGEGGEGVVFVVHLQCGAEEGVLLLYERFTL